MKPRAHTRRLETNGLYPITVYFQDNDEDLLAYIKAEAKTHDRSIAAQIRVMLRQIRVMLRYAQNALNDE